MDFETKDPEQRKHREQGCKPVGSGLGLFLIKCEHRSIFQHEDGRYQCQYCGDFVQPK